MEFTMQNRRNDRKKNEPGEGNMYRIKSGERLE